LGGRVVEKHAYFGGECHKKGNDRVSIVIYSPRGDRYSTLGASLTFERKKATKRELEWLSLWTYPRPSREAGHSPFMGEGGPQKMSN